MLKNWLRAASRHDPHSRLWVQECVTEMIHINKCNTINSWGYFWSWITNYVKYGSNKFVFQACHTIYIGLCALRWVNLEIIQKVFEAWKHIRYHSLDLVGLWPLNCQHFGADVAGVANLNMNYDRALPHAPAFRCSSQYNDVSGALDMTAQLGEEKYIEVNDEKN